MGAGIFLKRLHAQRATEFHHTFAVPDAGEAAAVLDILAANGARGGFWR